MLNFIWAFMMIIAFVSAIFAGKMELLSDSVIKGAGSAVELLISVTGIICFWSGMMEIADRSGITRGIAKLFSPVLSKLFKRVPKESYAMRYISLNISANLLGLGNAATPFGLSAMKELKKINNNKNEASDDMLLFVVLNTASIQLIPTTLCAYRSNYGSTAPFEIIPAVWLTSVVALLVGITVAKLFFKEERSHL
ncbi:MAG: nucleoside recognition domain-containing protein [Ruminococcus sp.]|nr:nucleoside recognition domain-containing protein [Ruminococcus sp.]